MSNVKNEIGNIYGRLEVLERSGSINSRAAWLVRCQCGRTEPFRVEGTTLRGGHATRCALCKKDDFRQIGLNNKKDLTGKKFGLLTVLEEAEPKYYKNKKQIVWKCLCDCGNIHYADATNLVNGKIKSCGCLVSAGEAFIKSVLNKYHIIYKSQYSPNGWYYNSGYSPVFDFVLFQNNKMVCAIEYHGEQHYKYYSNKNTWNNYDNFIKTQDRDKQKRNLCKERSLPLEEIPYTEYSNLEDIIIKICQKYKIMIL